MALKPITGLEPILSQTEKMCISSNKRQFPTNVKIKIIKLIPTRGGFLKKLFCLAKIGYGRHIFGAKFDLEDFFSSKVDAYISNVN